MLFCTSNPNYSISAQFGIQTVFSFWPKGLNLTKNCVTFFQKAEVLKWVSFQNLPVWHKLSKWTLHNFNKWKPAWHELFKWTLHNFNKWKLTFVTAISKSSCVTWTLLSLRAYIPASVQTPWKYHMRNELQNTPITITEWMNDHHLCLPLPKPTCIFILHVHTT